MTKTKAASRLCALNRTQEEIATLLGPPVTRQSVQQWQTGTIPEGKMMVRIQMVLKIPLEDWLEPAAKRTARA